jgi:hypothetical protein
LRLLVSLSVGLGHVLLRHCTMCRFSRPIAHRFLVSQLDVVVVVVVALVAVLVTVLVLVLVLVLVAGAVLLVHLGLGQQPVSWMIRMLVKPIVWIA